jgi:outer membrane lipoprotein LolB
MRRALSLLLICTVLGACVSTRRAPAPLQESWQQRAAELQKLDAWQLDGRAAVAVDTQGWQASLNWRQRGDATEVHLSGPLGVGALLLKRTAAGLSLNDAAPSDAVLAQLQERLGFELPIDHLRFWLLGVPDPGAPFELERNAQDRALRLTQDDWAIAYDRYLPVAGDVLPGHLVLSREGVRVRIVVDRWVQE